VTVTSAALASVGGDRVRVLLGLEPAFPAAQASGPALTVQGGPGDNLALHHAVAAARPGDVIVLAVGGHTETAHCGGIVVEAARRRGVAAIVVDGAIRDRLEIAEGGFPIFHLGSSPRKPAKNGPAALNVAVELLGVRIEPGDLVAADADGIAIVAAADADELVAAAAALEAKEQDILAQLAGGATTVEIYGLEPL
jgi:4-hydroxy-4-methyl-2-oxoglutarate aldolase